jgi:predicted transcriptional regulator
MKAHDYNEMLKDELKNPKFLKEYEALKEEFDVSRQVIELRLRKGLTQKDLAEKVHTTQSSIARLESGSYRNLSLSYLRRIGSALGAEPHVKFEKLRTAH